MKIKKQVVFRCVAGEGMLIPVGDTVSSYNGIFTFSGIGEFIWRSIENGLDEAQIIKAVTDEYDIDEETARRDTDEFITKLCDYGIVER